MLALPPSRKELSEQDVKQDSSNDAEAIFIAAERGFNVKFGNQSFVIHPEVPLITDCFGLSPLDYAFGMCKEIQQDKEYCVRFLEMPKQD